MELAPYAPPGSDLVGRAMLADIDLCKQVAMRDGDRGVQCYDTANRYMLRNLPYTESKDVEKLRKSMFALYEKCVGR